MISILENPGKEKWEKLTERPVVELTELFPLVQDIFKKVKDKGDQALAELTLKYDKVKLNHFKVTDSERETAESKISDDLKSAMDTAYANLYKFHHSQIEEIKKIETTEGVVCHRESRAIDKVGFYIPGGSAPLFSTVLMLAVPAKIAGCKEITICTPPDAKGEVHPAILYAAKLAGITAVYKSGGIQAIAAMSLGTESIPKVYKIFGPGNQYVMAAKQVAQNYGTAIDLPAGPSEVLVIADQTAHPEFVAADLLSQAEHGADSQVILLSNKKDKVEQILTEVENQLSQLPRKQIAAKALRNSKAIYFKTLKECMDFSNAYAPEHLILAVQNPDDWSSAVQNAGSVFLGHYSCESAGDYASGTNHTLPTNAYAKAYSGVSVDSFIKKISFQKISSSGLQNIGKAIEVMADAEGLFAHKNAISIRLKHLLNN